MNERLDQRPRLHVGIIMDGNGRWSDQRGWRRHLGHGPGAEATCRVVEAAQQLGIGYLTLYGFSSENWQRPKIEIAHFMDLLRRYLHQERHRLQQIDTRVRVIGDRERFPEDIRAFIAEIEDDSKDNSGMELTIALSYSGRREIVKAAQYLARQAALHRIDPDQINEALFASCLETAPIPDPDLVIRTGGEKRLSNFLLWQSAYTEFIFTERLWPDFSKADLVAAIEDFRHRNRRYGGVLQPITEMYG